MVVKKIKISQNCEIFLGQILSQLEEKNTQAPTVEVDLSVIVEGFKKQNVTIDKDDLQQARSAGYVGEVVVGEGNNLSCTVHYHRLRKSFLPIKLMNAITAINEKKSKR